MPTEKEKAAELKKLLEAEKKEQAEHEKLEAAVEKAAQDKAEVAAEKAAPKAKAVHLVAYSDFELLGKQYATGDAFTVPEGWVHEPGFDTFRSSEFKNKGERDLGMAFTVPGEITNKKTGERGFSRQVLPVKEG